MSPVIEVELSLGRSWPVRALARAALALLLASGCPGRDPVARQQPTEQALALGERLPRHPGVHSGVLGSGVRYLIAPLSTPGGTVRLTLVVRAGALAEQEQERGVAHFLEHVATDPAQQFRGVAPLELLKSQGQSLGADSNAGTHLWHTEYFLTLAGRNQELLGKGLDVLAGWAQEVRFEAGIVERQRAIVLAELRGSELDEQGVLARSRRFFAEGLQLAGRSVLGDAAAIQATSPAALESFYRRLYRPENFTLVIVGEVEPAALIQQLGDRFGAEQPATAQPLSPAPAAAPPAPHFASELSWLLRKASEEGSAGAQASYVLQLPSPALQLERDLRLQLVDRALCGLLDARLSAMPALARFRCAIARPGGRQVQLRLNIGSRPPALRPALEATVVELQRVAQRGTSAEELQRARALLSAQAPAPESVGSLSQQLIEQVIEEHSALSPSQRLQLDGKLWPTLTPDDLQARARSWLAGARRLVIALPADDDVSLPSEAALGELLQEIEQRQLAQPAELAAMPELMPVLPEPGEIVREQRADSTGVTRFQLANGATVSFRAARSGADRAYLTVLPAPTVPASSAEGELWNERRAADVVRESGAGAWDAAAISRMLGGRSTTVRLGSEVTATSNTRDLELTLQLVHSYLTAPRAEPSVFEALVTEARRWTPGQQFEHDLLGHVSSGEAATGASLEGALRSYRDRFANAARLQIVLVADVEHDRARSLVERYLASLPGSGQSPAPARTTAVAAQAAAREIRRVRRSDRPSSESLVVLRFAGAATPSPEARVELHALQTQLQRRLRQRLREQLRAVYDVTVSAGWAEAGSWQEIRFDCAPERVALLEAAVLDVVGELREGRVSDADLKSLVEWYSAPFPGAFQADSFWHAELTHAVREQADPQRILRLPALVSRISAPHLQQAARRHLPLDNYVVGEWSPRERGR